MPRSPIKDFQLGSRAYVNASVSFYTVAGGERTATLATLYAAETGAETLGNPVKLDGYGKFKRIPYIDVQVIGVVNGLGIPSHETGVISPAPTFRVNSSTSALEYSYDGGVSWSDSNGDIFKPRGTWAGPGTAYNLLDLVTNGGIVYVCVTPHSSAAAFATDLAASRWVTLVSFTAAAIANVPAGNIASTNVQDAINELDTEKAPIASPVFTGNPTAPTPSAGDNDTSIATTAFVVAAIAALAAGPSADLVEMLHIDSDTAHRDMIADGWMPAFFNQQWGGAPHYFELVDGATGTPYKFEAATGYVDQQTTLSVGNGAANTWASQGFKVSQTGAYSAIWVKIAKNGNPTSNLEMRILPDDGTGTKPTGSTAITNGTATAISGKLLSSDTGCQWVRFTFPTPPTLTAGTQYHITLKSSAAVDASNYFLWASTSSATSGKYPHGNLALGDGTPTWTASATFDECFLVEAPASLSSIQTGGIFNDGKLTFFEGSPLNQSNGRVKDLRDFRGLDLTDCTLLIRGSAWTKDKTILDIQYGMDHDRIVLRSAITTGYPTLTVYEQDGSVHTVTGTTDVSSGNHDIGIRIRAKNDGSDEIALWVDGASQGTPISSANISFDTLFGLAQIGTAWIGGGFALAPTWTSGSISAFTALPSALSPAWTYVGAATEGSAFSVSGNAMYQNYGGYTALQDGYYRYASPTFSNANGWAAAINSRIERSTNTKSSACAQIAISDGSKLCRLFQQEYYVEQHFGAGSVATEQMDFKAAQNVHYVVGKGSDVFQFVNGRMIYDGSSALTGATANNRIEIGDAETTSGEHSDVVWKYAKFYNTAWLPPQFTAGALSELAFWNGDKTSLLNSLYNSGAFTSVKQFCGVEKNYIGNGVVQRYTLGGITSGSTTTSTTNAAIDEMSCFAVGGLVSAQLNVGCGNNVAGSTNYTWLTLDGILGSLLGDKSIDVFMQDSASYIRFTHAQLPEKRVQFGLHKLEGRWGVSGNTLSAYNTFRSLGVEARA